MNTATAIKIGRSTYTVTGSAKSVNASGQVQTMTDLRGKRGSSATMIETAGCPIVTVIHFGRTKPASRYHVNDITYL